MIKCYISKTTPVRPPMWAQEMFLSVFCPVNVIVNKLQSFKALLGLQMSLQASVHIHGYNGELHKGLFHQLSKGAVCVWESWSAPLFVTGWPQCN